MFHSFFLFFSRYDPTTRPWYYAAKSYPGKVTFSVPYLVSNIQEFTKSGSEGPVSQKSFPETII